MQQNGDTQRYAFLVTRVAVSRPRRPNGPGSSGARRRRCNVKSAGQACFEEKTLAPGLDRSWRPSDHHGAATPPLAGTKIPHLSCGADTAASPIVEGDRPTLEDPDRFPASRPPLPTGLMSRPCTQELHRPDQGPISSRSDVKAICQQRRHGEPWESESDLLRTLHSVATGYHVLFGKRRLQAHVAGRGE